MESQEGAPSTPQQPEPSNIAQEGAQTAAKQSDTLEVEETSHQQPEPQGAEGLQPTAAQHPQTLIANEGAPSAAQQPETTGARDDKQALDQHLEPTGSVSAEHTTFRSVSAPPALQTLPVHQPPLPQDINQASATDYGSDLSNATDTTNCSNVSLHSNHPRPKCQIHTDGSENENGVGRSGTLRQGTGSPKELEPSLATDTVSRPEATQTDQPHDTSSGSSSVSRKDSRVTTTWSMNSNVSTASSSSDPTRSDILGSGRSTILDTDEDEVDETTLVTHLMKMVEFYSDYFKGVEQLQAEEYIMFTIKRFAELATNLTAEMYIIAGDAFGSSEAESTDRSSASQMTEEGVERSELSTILERRLQAVTDYVRTTSEATTDAAIAEMIIQEYNAEIAMAKSSVLPDEESPTTQEASSDVGHDVEAQDGGAQTGRKTYSDSDGALGGEKEVEGISAEVTDSPVQTTSVSVKRAREVKGEEAVGRSGVKIGTTKEELEKSRTYSSCDRDIDGLKYLFLIEFERYYTESNLQRKIHKSHQKAAVLKMSSLAELRVCVIRNMNWMMLRCLKTVTYIVNQALEANRVAHRAISETEALRSAGTSGDYIDAMAEAATAVSEFSDTSVIVIEEAVRLHTLIVDALNLTERTLFILKTETHDGIELVRHLFLCVQFIDLQVTRACRTYLDKAKVTESPDSGSSLVFPTSGGVHGPVVSMAFDNVEDGPSDVFQALIWASQSAIDTIDTLVNCLRDFSIAKRTHRRRSDNK